MTNMVIKFCIAEVVILNYVRVLVHHLPTPRVQQVTCIVIQDFFLFSLHVHVLLA